MIITTLRLEKDEKQATMTTMAMTTIMPLKIWFSATGCQCIAEIIVFGLFYVLTD